MKITKLGHCCLVIETKGFKILTDPGAYTELQNNIRGIDIVLITHEHPDHFHLDSLHKVLKNNPQAKIITNSAVGKYLKKERLNFLLVEHGDSLDIKDLNLEGLGEYPC